MEFCGVIVKDPYQSIAIPFSCYVYLSVLGIPLNLLGYTNIIPNIYFKSRDVEWFPCATSLIRKRGFQIAQHPTTAGQLLSSTEKNMYFVVSE